MNDDRGCACHPDDRPELCAHRYATSECQKKAQLRKLVDIVWHHATEGQQFPSTKIADALIEKYIAEVGAVSAFSIG